MHLVVVMVSRRRTTATCNAISGPACDGVGASVSGVRAQRAVVPAETGNICVWAYASCICTHACVHMPVLSFLGRRRAPRVPRARRARPVRSSPHIFSYLACLFLDACVHASFRGRRTASSASGAPSSACALALFICVSFNLVFPSPCCLFQSRFRSPCCLFRSRFPSLCHLFEISFSISMFSIRVSLCPSRPRPGGGGVMR